jgi:uncharacterized membrane protein
VRVQEDRGRSAERLVTFTDAVVAIAITLLALPLADIVREHGSEGLGAVLAAGAGPFFGFALSFFVIARLWWGHHRIFAHVVRWDGLLVYLTVFWLFTIVLLAPVTGLTDVADPRNANGRGTVALYIGVMTVSSALLTALSWRIHRRPELTDGHDVDAELRLVGSIETTVGFALALVIGTAFPVINYFALFVLVVTGRVGDLLWRRRGRRRRT